MNLTHNPRFLFLVVCCAVAVGSLGYWRVQAQQGAHPFYRSAAMPAMFATLTVTKTADTNDGVCDADCSLREAIAAANANDTIQFSALFNAPQTITLALGELAINQSLTIQGPGANLLTVSGNNAVRVFRTTAGDVAISGLTIANGNAAGDVGGGLRKQGAGSVTLTNCAITGNRADIGAGLFFDDGTVDLIGCTINDNAAANSGGALSNQGATLRMTNCTVTNNSATGNGSSVDGLLLTGGATTLKHCTIVRNNQVKGGNVAVQFDGGTLTIQNNIIALQDNGIFNGLGNGTVNSLGNNLISSFGGIIAGLPGPNDLIGVDPQLGYLGNNGGPTLTIAPLPGSVVIDKGAASNPAIVTDQRVLTRPVDQGTIANGPGSNASDIGAVEVQLLAGFPCDKALYYSQGDNGQPTQLYALTFDNFNQLYGLRQIGTNNLGVSYNAIGMRAQDGYIYATEAPAGAAIPRIFRIDSTGFLTSLGQPVGLPGGADKYVTGAIGADGFYYIRQQNQNTLYRIDVSGGAATLAATVAIGAGEVGDDWAWNVTDNELYTVTANGDLRRIHPTTGVNTLVAAGAFPAGTYGAVWINAVGELHALLNSNGGGNGELYVWTGGATANFVGSGAEGVFNDGCSCLDAPYLAKTFAGFLSPGQTTTLTFRVVNGPTAKTVDFSDAPVGMRFVPGTLTPANPFGGTANAYGNSQLLTITGMMLPALADATFTVQVQAITADPSRLDNQALLTGSMNNVAFGIPSENPDTSGFCDVTPLGVDPGVGFNPACVAAGSVFRAVIPINNAAGVGALSNLSANVALAGSLSVAPVPNVFNNCGGTVAGATAGSTALSLTGGSLPAGPSTCRIEVDVLTSTPGQLQSGVNATATTGGTTLTLGPVSGLIEVAAAPTLNKSFTPAQITQGGTSQLTLTLTSPANNFALDNVTVSDTFPAGMTVAAAPGLSNTCGGTVNGATAGSNSISLTGGTLPANGGSCQIIVNVTSNMAGVATNTTGNVTATKVGGFFLCSVLTGAPATATLSVCPPAGCAPPPPPPPAPVLAGGSGDRAGSLLVFPYYTSKAATQSDTRLSISNIGNQVAIAHVFFIDGTSCQQSDFFVCLTPNASFAFTAAAYDPEITGYVLAVAVDQQGRPVQNNGLIGNAFVRDGQYVGNYGAESFWAYSTLPATVQGTTTTLAFDGVGYDAVPKQFAVEVQSPVDVIGQQVITASLKGDLTTGALTGAAQDGTGQAFNEKEVFASFSGWLTGGCQVRATITANSPRVPNGLNNLIKTGQAGSLKFNVGGAVGLLLTPRTATWRGIRTLHKTQVVNTTLIIPIFTPVC